MAVMIGSARIDERGRATGGKAGNQTGKELSTQSWYNHSKGWRVFRAKNPVARKKIATCMKAACENQKIGYDQAERNTLYKAAKPFGFDVSKVTKAVETDCSALVRVCVNYAGIELGDILTVNEPAKLLATGAFTELVGEKYTAKSDYLAVGDILCTRTKGHTVVVLSDGPKVEDLPCLTDYKFGERTLKNGCSGADVCELQGILIQMGYSCGPWGADGDYGDATEQAVMKFQRDHGIAADGIAGNKTFEMLDNTAPADSVEGTSVLIIGGNCFVREEPNIQAQKFGVAYNGTRLAFCREVSADGWLKVAFNNQNGWISGKYGRIEK